MGQRHTREEIERLSEARIEIGKPTEKQRRPQENGRVGTGTTQNHRQSRPAENKRRTRVLAFFSSYFVEKEDHSSDLMPHL